MANIIAILATIAGIVMSLGYYPQAFKIIKRKSAKDVSPTTYLMFFPGIVIWLIYGISLKDFPLIIANIVALIGCAFVLIAYSIFKKK
jgi:MtN3 and saliva related transmembrane protein